MLGPMLRGVGIEIDEPTLQMISIMLPQLPVKINEVFQAINLTIANFDSRLMRIELELSIIRQRIEVASHGIDTTEPVLRPVIEPTSGNSGNSGNGFVTEGFSGNSGNGFVTEGYPTS